MEIDPDGFEQLTKVANTEDKSKQTKSKETENKWARLEAKYGGAAPAN